MRCWANTFFILIVVVLGLASILGACGQKGDLYLPEPVPVSRSDTPPGADVPTPPPASGSSSGPSHSNP
ncbi:MAG: LPS translocon maturation chaperone LptM [Thermochromatium sp.]